MTMTSNNTHTIYPLAAAAWKIIQDILIRSCPTQFLFINYYYYCYYDNNLIERKKVKKALATFYFTINPLYSWAKLK